MHSRRLFVSWTQRRSRMSASEKTEYGSAGARSDGCVDSEKLNNEIINETSKSLLSV